MVSIVGDIHKMRNTNGKKAVKKKNSRNCKMNMLKNIERVKGSRIMVSIVLKRGERDSHGDKKMTEKERKGRRQRGMSNKGA